MRIEALTKFLSDGHVYEKGDIRGVPDELGKNYCRLGWAKDVDGKVPTGEPDVSGKVSLEIQNSKISTRAK